MVAIKSSKSHTLDVHERNKSKELKYKVQYKFILYVLEPQVLMIHHTYPGISRSGDQRTYENIRLSHRLDIYIKQSIS